ncbi:MAG: alanine dehydrogenase [Alphaproteobacteria bacterium]|nr:alanine dehydrogenase [Alphaproteobacteria bacterium]
MNIAISKINPLEELLSNVYSSKNLKIGIPKDSTTEENRVSLTPEAVGILVQDGFEILLQEGAGINSGYSNLMYANAGATIVSSNIQALNCPIVLKTAPFHCDEIVHLQTGALLLSPIHYAMLKKETLVALIEKKVSAISYEKFSDKTGSLPLVKSMSEIAGSASMFIAAQYMNRFHNGNGMLLGGITGIPPTKVIIIGAGTVGEFAARSALALGASVKVFDNDLLRLKKLENNIGHRIWTSIIEPNILAKQIKNADIAVGALHSYNGKTPLVVTEDMVKNMKQGSIIIDIAIDKGGCFETSDTTSHAKPIQVKHGVIHYAVPNIPSAYSRTASQAISNILLQFLLDFSFEGSFEDLIKSKHFIAKGCYLYNGMITDKFLNRKFGFQLLEFDQLISKINAL